MNELVVAVGANAGVNEISFTVQFDPDVLQVRAGTEGSWAEGAGLDARFAAEISETGDRVQIRSAVSGQRTGVAGGSVAIVQFQAVGPGTTSIVITDVVVKDLAGRSIASAASASSANDGGLRATAAARGVAPAPRRRRGTACRDHRRRRLRPNAIQRRQLALLRFRTRRRFRR